MCCPLHQLTRKCLLLTLLCVSIFLNLQAVLSTHSSICFETLFSYIYVLLCVFSHLWLPVYEWIYTPSLLRQERYSILHCTDTRPGYFLTSCGKRGRMFSLFVPTLCKCWTIWLLAISVVFSSCGFLKVSAFMANVRAPQPWSWGAAVLHVSDVTSDLSSCSPGVSEWCRIWIMWMWNTHGSGSWWIPGVRDLWLH